MSLQQSAGSALSLKVVPLKGGQVKLPNHCFFIRHRGMNLVLVPRAALPLFCVSAYPLSRGFDLKGAGGLRSFFSSLLICKIGEQRVLLSCCPWPTGIKQHLFRKSRFDWAGHTDAAPSTISNALAVRTGSSFLRLMALHGRGPKAIVNVESFVNTAGNANSQPHSHTSPNRTTLVRALWTVRPGKLQIWLPPSLVVPW